MIMVAMTSELSYNEMTPLLILLAAVFLGTGKCSRELLLPIAASMFVKFKSVIEIFWDEDFMVRNTVKKDNLDFRPLSVEDEDIGGLIHLKLL